MEVVVTETEAVVVLPFVVVVSEVGDGVEVRSRGLIQDIGCVATFGFQTIESYSTLACRVRSTIPN